MNPQKSLVKLITTRQIAYNPHDKQRFHRLSKQVLRQIAKDIGLKDGEYEVRSNEGGIGVSGEITLHGQTIYIQFSQSIVDSQFMFRSCKGQRDYSGGVNQWMPWAVLEKDYQEAVRRFKLAAKI